MAGRDPVPAAPDRYDVYLIRDREVVLDAEVARGFGVDTKRVNEAVRRNPAKFDDSHVFRLTPEEAQALRSQIATSNTGRGGARYDPQVFTAKGVARLATILDTDEALRATDLIIDTFLQVQSQVAAGRKTLAIEDASKLRPEDRISISAQIHDKLATAVSALLDTVIDVGTRQTVGEAALDLGAGALRNLRDRLRKQGLENTKLEADALLVTAQAEKVYAETRKLHAEAEGVALDNIPKRIAAVKELIALYNEVGPTQMVRLLTRMGQGAAIELQRALPAPDEDR